MALERTTIDNAFRTVLARAATDAEAQQYGTSAGQMALQAVLYDTTAYKTEVLPIAAMYSSILGRQPDPSGLSFWVNALRDGKVTMEQAADMFLSSPEASASFGYVDASNEVFISRNYHNALGREPDAAGLKFWVGLVDSHTLSRAEAAVAIATSPEHMAAVAGTHYAAFGTGAVTGVVADGYLANATVFADANGDGVWNLGEARTLTDANGHFSLENATGNLIAVGGRDVSTGLEHTGAYTAAAGSSVLNPLTTLQQNLMAGGQSAEQAQHTLAVALKLDLDGVDLRTFDPFAATIDSHASAADQAAALKVQVAAAKVANLLVAGSSTLVGAAGQGNLTAEEAFKGVAASLATTIEKAGSAGVDLSDKAVLQSVLKDSVGATGNAALTGKADTVAAMSGDFAQLMAATSQKIDTAAAGNQDAAHALAQVVQVQTAVQGTVSASLQAGAAQGTVRDLVSSLTGGALNSIVSKTVIGDLDPASTADDAAIKAVNPEPPASSGGGGGGATPGPVTRTVTVAQALAGNHGYTAADTVTVSDTAAHIAALTAAQITGLDKVDLFRATDSMLQLTVDQALAMGSGRMYASNDVRIKDTGAHITALTPAQLTAFANVDAFWTTEGFGVPVTISLAQFNALRAERMFFNKTVLQDTQANIEALTPAQISSFMMGLGTRSIQSTSGTLTLNADQAGRLSASGIEPGTAVTLLDTGVKLQALSPFMWGSTTGVRFDATDNVLTLSWLDVQRLRPENLSPDDTVTLSDTASGIGWLTADQLANPNVDVIHVSDSAPVTLWLSVDTATALLPKFDGSLTITLSDKPSAFNTDLVYDARVQSAFVDGLDPIDWPLHAPSVDAEIAALAKLPSYAHVRLNLAGSAVEGVTIATALLLDPHVHEIRAGAELQLSVSTLAAINAVLTTTVEAGAGVRVAATNGQDQVSDIAVAGGSLTLEYTAAGQAGTAVGQTGRTGLSLGDWFTLQDVDVVEHNDLFDSQFTQDRVLLSNFALSAGTDSDFDTDGTIDNGHFVSIRGQLQGNNFTVTPGGSDTLVLWDADTGSGVRQAAVVLRYTAAVVADTTQAGSGNVLIGSRPQITLTVSEALAQNAGLDSLDNVVVVDTEQNIAALTASQIAALSNVDRFHATNNELHLSAAQALAMGWQKMSYHEVSISDTASAIEALTADQLQSQLLLVVNFHATDGVLTLNASQAGAMLGTLTVADQIVLADTGANLSAMFAEYLGYVYTFDLDAIHVTDGGAVRMNTAVLSAVTAKLDGSVHLVLEDAAAVLSSSTYLTDARVQSIHATDGMPIQLIDPGLLAKLESGDSARLTLASPVEGGNITTAQLLDPHLRELAPETGEITISAATLQALTTAGVALQAPVHVHATAGQDIVSDHAIATGSLWLHYDASALAGTAVAHLAGTTLANGDTFALTGVDRIDHDPAATAVRDLVSFGAGLGLQSSAWSSLPEQGVVADSGYATVSGRLNGDVFTVDTTGTDVLVLWDDDPAAGTVTQHAVAVVGAGALQHWYDDTAHTIIVGVQPHA